MKWAMIREIEAGKPDLICLAGYMRILTEGFVRRFRGKILNVHPSLLPAFKGVDTHHRALVTGVKIYGASVHFVDEVLDGGQIISQVAVPVHADDDDDSLAERVLQAEHQLYPHALALVASGAVRLSGSRMVVSRQDTQSNEAVLFSPPPEMNYRHEYHAGNFADVFKHLILSRIIEHLKRKEKAFRVIDTHAGSGRYHLPDAGDLSARRQAT